MQLILVRHALPHRVRPADLADGATADPGLTELGERQAERLVGALRADRIDGLYSSPLRRAQGTAAPLAAALGCTPDLVPGLREYDADQNHYVPVHDMPRVDPAAWERMLAGLLPEHIDADAFRERVVTAVEAIVTAHPGRESAVLVAHAGVINVYLAHLLDIPRTLAFPLDYTGVTRVIAGRDGRRAVRTVNEITHVADLLAQVTGTGSAARPSSS
ncbi:histidine phosphatase family protein [Pseudonocardia bannensis]|uniref:Histidine phosphatase family protein n=1 Tax=Pseudonocardia bannensis TaxID=630973 RepID=A0A848DLJ4_9PSEU|nr:histidine phosphatase family protein [Pseudonocardia bannensis]NMH93640.1 histidine phosphatase family protein [Pseudonocardia bannensis]